LRGKEITMKKALILLVQLTVLSQEVKQEKVFILQVILLLMILDWSLQLRHLKKLAKSRVLRSAILVTSKSESASEVAENNGVN